MVDPVFSADDDRGKKALAEEKPRVVVRLMSMDLQSQQLRFPRLPLTAQLGLALKESDPLRTDLFEGIRARKALLLTRELSPYKSVVFGTHGYFGKDIPGLKEPVLVLTLVDQSEGDDGFLRMSEVMGLKLNADMVALTACQSGLGGNCFR